METKRFTLVILFIYLAGCELNSLSRSSFTSSDVAPIDATTPTDTTAPTVPSIPVTPTTPTAPVCDGGPTVFTNGMNARRVIGQANFAGSSANRGISASANTLSKPLGISLLNGKIFIGDADNNRVLIYDSLPISDGANANSVVGQADFTSSTGGATASSFNGMQGLSVSSDFLAVAEWGSRVSFWPISNLSQIQFSLGQPNQTSSVLNNGGISANTIANATNVIKAGGKYFVNDAGNHRVLIYTASTIGQQSPAVVVLGQNNFGTSSTGTASNQVDFPLGLATDGNKLIIVDSGNDRLLIYNSIPTSSGATPDVVWGGYGVTNLTLNSPVGAFYDGTKLFVADRGSDRILIFNSLPTSALQAADVVLGHSTFTNSDHNDCSCSVAKQNSLWGAHFMHYDGCRLYVSDTQNNRVVIF